MPRLDFLRLKTRIALGFASICLLLGIVGLISYGGLQRSKDNFLLFAGFSDEANLLLEIGKNASELQRQTQRFTYEGHEITEQRVYSLQRALRVDLDKALKSAKNEETKRIIGNMAEHLRIYGDTFKMIVSERKLRNELVQRNLRKEAEESEERLLAYIQSHTGKKEEAHTSGAEMLLNDLLSIEKNAFRYFDLLDSTLIAKAKKNFYNLHGGIRKLRQEEGDSNARKLLNETEAMVSEYEKALIRAVQATRSYLYLVNVVMAGEASEFLYNAAKLKDLADKNMKDVKYELAQVIGKTHILIATAIISSVLTGMLLSLLVGQSITLPLAQMTRTFNLLAKGDHSSQIPGHDFRDEIGELSRAADVFKEKNRQTEQLLERTQSLAGELEEKRKELARSNDELEQFVYTVSHDLKSPLVTSMGFIGMINDLAEKGDLQKAISKLDRVVQANKRMGQLINDLLELSRVGRVDMDNKDLDMNLLLKNFRESLGKKLRDEKFDLVYETPFPVIYANESRVLQVFENMMSNAFKYGGNPSKNVVSIGSRKGEGEELFYIRDKGRGIPKEYQEKIFSLFYRLDKTTPGTGIGLSVARKVMQFHGGRIWVESEEGKGATFWLAFPKRGKERIIG